mmetsp:Transcript_16081/g.23862  ORF Transcript_16081/g.23862 Transcript_16081/m.23862 type:complete len:375 (+) Transcript_16081:1-1125(+)
MMGILYWCRNVQTYKKDGFSFMERLHQFVDSGFRDPPDFFDDVSRIVSRGCHQKSCGNVISGAERKRTFDEIILYFGNAQAELSSSKQTLSPTNVPSTIEPINAAKPTTRPTTHKPTSRPTLFPTTSKSDSTSQPTTSQVTTKPSDYTTHLSKEELNRRMNFSNNYCATSLEEVESKCATTLRTCNYGQPLCSVGQACFGNILCSAAAQFITQMEENNPINCGDTCLRPLTFQECESGSRMGAFVSLPICSDVRVGEFCKSSEESGGAVNVVNNCFEGQNVFMRVDICNSSQNSIPSTEGETTASKTQNITANIPILDDSISTIPTEPTEEQEAEPSSVLKTWWKHEFNEGTITTSTCLLHIFCTCATMYVLLC